MMTVFSVIPVFGVMIVMAVFPVMTMLAVFAHSWYVSTTLSKDIIAMRTRTGQARAYAHTLTLARAYCLRHSGWQFILSPTFASLRGQSDSDCPIV